MTAGTMRIVRFDPAAHDFAALLRTRLGVDDLTALVADMAGTPGWSIYKSMENVPSYQAWWALSESTPFGELYARFVRQVVLPLFDAPVLVQSCPTPRIVYADQSGESRFHRDADYGHSATEVNFQVVLTPSVASNAMWVESTPGAGDYRPAELQPGEMLMFDGANLSHGAVPNETGRSRVSFDFRAVALADAGEAHQRAGTPGAPPRGAHVFAAFA